MNTEPADSVNIQPVEVIHFEKVVDGKVLNCVLKRFDDGGVGLKGDDFGWWIFEFTDDAMERALKQAEKEGYVRTK